jgi:hypothetical protein
MPSLHVPRIRRHVLAVASIVMLLLAPGIAPAQQSERFGPYEVHYNTLNTNMLTPEIAQAYGIQRAVTRALLNVTVIQRDGNRPVPATVTASATNLTGQQRTIELRQVRDQDAIYQLGTFRVRNEEILTFRVEVQPEGRVGPPFTFSFRQQFYTD